MSTSGESNTTPSEAPPAPVLNQQFFRRLNWCELIYGQPLTVFANNAACFLTIAFVASVLRFGLAFIFDYVNGDNYGAEYGTEADLSGMDYNLDLNTNQRFDAATFTMNVVDAVILYVVACLADGATVQVVSEMYAGQAPRSAFTAFGTVGWKVVPLVGSCLLVSSLITGVFLVMMPLSYLGRPGGLFLVVAVWLAVAVYVTLNCFVMYPVIVVEGFGIMDSIKRSVQMTHGHLVQIFVVLAVLTLAKATVSVVLVSLTYPYEYMGNQYAQYTRMVFSFIINAFFMAVRSILRSVIYFHIRITDEELTQDKLCQEMGLLNQYTQMEANKDVEPAVVKEEPAPTTDVANKEVV